MENLKGFMYVPRNSQMWKKFHVSTKKSHLGHKTRP